MHRLSMVQALSIWSDLCEAKYGQSGYGGDTTEIYMYRLMPYDPTAHTAMGGQLAREARDERIAQANESLYALLAHFANEESVVITINGQRLGP